MENFSLAKKEEKRPQKTQQNNGGVRDWGFGQEVGGPRLWQGVVGRGNSAFLPKGGLRGATKPQKPGWGSCRPVGKPKLERIEVP